MKKVLIALFGLLLTAACSANPPHRGGHYYGGHNHGGGNWIAPLVVGGIIGYAIAERPQSPVIVERPVYPTVPVYPAPPYGYHYEQILDASCNCYKYVLIPN